MVSRRKRLGGLMGQLSACGGFHQARVVKLLLQAVGWALIAGLFTTGCAQTPAASTPGKSHHTPTGFKNNYIEAVDRPFTDLLRWQWAAFREGLPPAPRTPTPTQTADIAFLKSNAGSGSPMQPAVTWIGHASTLVQAGGLNVLTDPMFSERAFPVQIAGPKRQQPPGVALADLPPIDVVVISHNHYDHLDRQSVFALDQRSKAAPKGPQTLFLVPLGLKAWFQDLGISNVVELDWWDKHTVRGVDFYLTPVQHWSARSFNDRSRTLWGGWAVFSNSFNWYFSGDAGYSKDFADTKTYFESKYPRNPQRKLFDVALLALGAYEPRWFMAAQHINPAEAVQAHFDLGAERAIGIHWGTFNLTDEALDVPPVELDRARRAAGLSQADFDVLKIGETRTFSARPAK